MNKCLLDLDGVIADLVKSISKAHNLKSPYEGGKNYGEYFGLGNMCKWWKIEDSKLWSISTIDFWANIEPHDEYKEILNELESFFGKENICILSNPTNRHGYIEGCADGKIKWIKKHIPDYERQFLLGPAKHFCANKNTFLIDDYDMNVDTFREHGGNAFLVPRPWNSAYKDKDRIIEKLKEFLNNK